MKDNLANTKATIKIWYEDETDHCENNVTLPTNKNFSFASSNGGGASRANSDLSEFYYEEELELKLEKPKKLHQGLYEKIHPTKVY